LTAGFSSRNSAAWRHVPPSWRAGRWGYADASPRSPRRCPPSKGCRPRCRGGGAFTRTGASSIASVRTIVFHGAGSRWSRWWSRGRGAPWPGPPNQQDRRVVVHPLVQTVDHRRVAHELERGEAGSRAVDVVTRARCSRRARSPRAPGVRPGPTSASTDAIECGSARSNARAACLAAQLLRGGPRRAPASRACDEELPTAVRETARRQVEAPAPDVPAHDYHCAIGHLAREDIGLVRREFPARTPACKPGGIRFPRSMADVAPDSVRSRPANLCAAATTRTSHVAPDFVERRITDIQARPPLSRSWGSSASASSRTTRPPPRRAPGGGRGRARRGVCLGRDHAEPLGGRPETPPRWRSRRARGARIVWFPTVSSENEQQEVLAADPGGKGAGMGAVSSSTSGTPGVTPEGRLPVVDESGRACWPEARGRARGDRPPTTWWLATGHPRRPRGRSSPLVDGAVEAGVKTIVVTHPEFPSAAHLAPRTRLALGGQGRADGARVHNALHGQVLLGPDLRGHAGGWGRIAPSGPPTSARYSTRRWKMVWR